MRMKPIQVHIWSMMYSSCEKCFTGYIIFVHLSDRTWTSPVSKGNEQNGRQHHIKKCQQEVHLLWQQVLHPYYQEILPECHHYKALSICHNLLQNRGVCDKNQGKRSVEDVRPCHSKMKIIHCLRVIYSNSGWSPLSIHIIIRLQPSTQKHVSQIVLHH